MVRESRQRMLEDDGGRSRMNTVERQAVALARSFYEALVALVTFHGEALNERSLVVIDSRPGMLWLGERGTDGLCESRPVLVVEMDGREPGSFGRRVEVGDRGNEAD